MENKKTLFIYGVIAMFLLITGTYTQIINYADAVPTVATIPYGLTFTDDADTLEAGVATAYNNLGSDKAWFVGENSVTGVVNVLVKSAATDTIVATIPLGTGHTDATAIAYIEDYDVIVVSTNLGYAVIDEDSSIMIKNVTSATFDDFFDFYYHRADNILYGLQPNGYMKMTYNAGAIELQEIITVAISDCENNCFFFDIDETNDLMFLNNAGGDATDSLIKVSLATDLVTGEIVIATGSPWGVASDSASDVVYVAVAASAQVRKYDHAFTSLLATITVTSTPRSIEFDSVNDKLYVIADSDDTIRIYDGTTNTQIGSSLAVCSAPTHRIQVKTNTDETLVFIPCAGSSGRVVHSDLIIEGAIDDIVCVDVNFDGVTDVCYEDVNGDGVPDASPLELIRGSQNITESANNIACQIGIETACDNPDPKTNGVGFLLVIVLLAFMIVLFALARLHTNLIVPEWLWIIGTFTVLGASIFLGWIDTTLFIIGVIVIIAMASFKIVAQFVGSDF